MKQKLRNIIYPRCPIAKDIWALFNVIIGRVKPPTFSGWGMTTSADTPWKKRGGNAVSQSFIQVHKHLVKLVSNGDFILSQFRGSSCNHKEILEGFMWRHYIIYWSVTYAIKTTISTQNNLVECGVCDGMSAYFAIGAARDNSSKFKYYLYDAWEGMNRDYLLKTEYRKEGEYSYLQIENTIKNLLPFQDKTIFNKGFIPGSFQASENPDSLVWMHIDLNSALPTVGALDFFFDKLECGGIVLLDDYADPNYEDTKTHVDKWLENKPGLLLPLPTGQSIIFKQKML